MHLNCSSMLGVAHGCYSILMNLNVGWMQLPPAQWPGDGDYIRFQNTMTNRNVVNDAAEKAVKYVTDFADYSRDPANGMM